MSMRFGIMLEGQEGLTWDHWHRIAARVEASGLDSLWRSDHFFSVMGAVERDSLETWASLAVLADRTRRLRFGPLVCSMTFRAPALLARMAAAVDQLGDGRLELGVGAGWYEREHQAFGIPFPPVKERMDRLEEGIEVLRRLWGPDPARFEGRYWQLRDAVCRPNPASRMGHRWSSAARAKCACSGSWRSTLTSGTATALGLTPTAASARCSRGIARRSAATRKRSGGR
jgi:alkanesulfonate monooxygenase SsuD/methylene tetrahydromethanopterin reductase-like flavin-dependent oxidoreductase (luciferase family)